MIRQTMLAGLLLCAPCAGALAQGSFDFDRIPGVPDEPTVQVDLNAALLGFAAGAARVNDPATADMLEGIEGIRVRVYETLRDPAAVASFVEGASRELEREGWQRVVYAQEDDEKVRVYVRMDGEEMRGMTIMVLDSEDAVFVNVAGRIDPEQLGRIAGAMGMGDIIGDITGAQRYFGPVQRSRDY